MRDFRITSPRWTWPALSVHERARRVCALRHLLVEQSASFLQALQSPARTADMESIAAEIIPLADACAFLERNAVTLLRPRPLGGTGRPLWLRGVSAEIHRDPLGQVLIIGPANYPLMLPGIQIAQALVAGNHVLFKPAPGTRRIATLLCDSLRTLGVPPESLILLDEDPASVQPWLPRADKVVMTGSESSGKAVLKDLAAHAVPAVMELSGCDALFVLRGADLSRVAAALRFGLTFNASATCMAPRRVFVLEPLADPLIAELTRPLHDAPPISMSESAAARLQTLGTEAVTKGAKLVIGQLPTGPTARPIIFDHAEPWMPLLQEDLMAPFCSIIRVNSEDDARIAYNRCDYRLGASVFGPPAAARAFARRISAGSIVVNDLIVPTADPRLPLGGQKRSGFGVTRGAEGLLEMTRVKTISIRGGASPFHLRPDAAQAGPLLLAYLGATHGRSWRSRMGAWMQLLREGKALSSRTPQTTAPKTP